MYPQIYKEIEHRMTGEIQGFDGKNSRFINSSVMTYLFKQKLEQTFNMINIIFFILSLLHYQNIR